MAPSDSDHGPSADEPWDLQICLQIDHGGCKGPLRFGVGSDALVPGLDDFLATGRSIQGVHPRAQLRMSLKGT